MNRVRSRDTGYTIVETMIFLVVSGALFLSAMLLLNGQQRKTEFSTSVRDFDSKLQSVIGNVASGYYNNPGQITCKDQPGPQLRINPIPSPQGQNSDCTFIGQYIYLDQPPNDDKFTFTSYAGLRLDASGKEVQSLTDAKPTPITETAEEYNLLSGVIAEMKLAGTATYIATLAITTTFNTYNGTGNLSSGSSRSEMHALLATGVEVTIPPAGIQICLSDGSQIGVIVLNTGSTRVTIGSNTSTCPP